MSIDATFSGLFEQLRTLEEFKALGKPTIGLDVFSDYGKHLLHVSVSELACLQASFLCQLSPFGQLFLCYHTLTRCNPDLG